MAIYRPRVFIIEKGGSSRSAGPRLCRHRPEREPIKFTPSTDISLPPYAKAFEALAQAEENERAMQRALNMSADDQFDAQGNLVAHDEDDEMRDYLGEMELITRMMITGADHKKEEQFQPPDKQVVRHAILEATRRQRAAGLDDVTPSNVVEMLRQMAEETSSAGRRERVLEMADALAYWTEGLHGKFFNRPGRTWPECDMTILDMGILTAENYKDMLAVTTNPTLVKPLVFGAKTWRKLNIRLDQATQNLGDYPDEASNMLSLAEWWYCLTMDTKEVKDLTRFRRLSEEEQEMLLSARKQKGAYTEGVILSDRVTSLFRVVMPALPLALAGTDDDEKAARRQLMEQHRISEIEAVHRIAEQIKQQRMAQ